MKRQRGFTLIEILIVVIILAVLAAMILPRFLSQTENAYIAEAQQVLGVLRRAQANQADLGISVAALAEADTVDDAKMAPLGLKAIAATNWKYKCDAAGATCTATRSAGPSATGTIIMAIGGDITCDGSKYDYVDSSYHSKGCRPKS